MSLLFMESADHQAAAQMTRKWTSMSGAAIVPGLHGNGWTATTCRMGLVFGNDVIQFGCAMKFASLGCVILSMADGGVTTQHQVTVQQDGSVVGNRFTGAATQLFLTAPDLIKTGQWYYIEYQALVHATLGTIQLRVNGIEFINLTGLNTTGVTFDGVLRSFAMSDASAVTHDDLIVMDTVDDGLDDPRWPSGGGGFDQFLGQIEIIVKRPNGAGFKAEFVPNTGANWQNVDDTTPDDDTTYNACAAADVGDEDIHEFEDLAVGEDILGAQHLVCSRKTEEGIASLKPIIRQDGVNFEGDELGVNEDYYYVNRVVHASAPDGTLWSKAKFDAIQAGYTREQ